MLWSFARQLWAKAGKVKFELIKTALKFRFLKDLEVLDQPKDFTQKIKCVLSSEISFAFQVM